MKIENPTSMVGDTPTVHIATHKDVRIWAKLEGQNPTGSLKDRTASAFVSQCKEKYGTSRQVLDASSGSFACALAYYARLNDIRCTVVVNSKISEDNVAFLKTQGASIVFHGTVTGESRAHCLQLLEESPDAWYFTDQLTNPLAPSVHEQTTAREIFQDHPSVSAIIASKGSGATLCGICRYVEKNQKSTKVFGSVGIPGDEKKIAGTYVEGADFVSSFINEVDGSDSYFGDIPVTYREAMQSCLELPCLVGPQGGGVFTAAIRAIEKHGLTGDVVLIMGDTLLKNVSRFG